MLRVVIDTNVWVSGLVWGGPARQLIQRVISGTLRSHSSPALVSEFERVLLYPRIHTALRKRGLSAEQLSAQFALLSDVVEAAPLLRPISRDPDDDAVLACAVTAGADLIVTGDRDLLVLHPFQGLPILTATQALAWPMD